MKQYISLLVSLLLAFSIYPLQAQNELKQFVFFNDSTLVSKYEVRNNEYRQFLWSFSRDEIPVRFKPDSSLWYEEYGRHLENMTSYYFQSPSYDNYPVVNISKEAMEAYCDWRTNVYNENPDRKYKKVLFRLPHEREWMTFAAAKPGLALPWVERAPYRIGKRDRIVPLANLKVLDYNDSSYNYTFDLSVYPARTGFYPPNDLGIFEVIGNVAEMTYSGVIKGGSWDNTPEESEIHKMQNFKIPHPCVGFRIVMEIVSE